MFTGIIEGVGTIRVFKKRGDWAELEVSCDFDLERSNVGDSIAVNGCCLTIISRLGKSFWAELSPETLSTTIFQNATMGDPVNLERALQWGQRLGGHLVQGHIDGVGKIKNIKVLDGGIAFHIEIPGNLSRYVIEKGSVAIDGVSLTVNECGQDRFWVTVVPHTKLKTTFSQLSIGDEVNLEVDMIGKYVEKLTFLDSETYQKGNIITKEFLKKHGF